MPLIPLLLLAAARGTASSVPVTLRQEFVRADAIAEALPIAAEKKWALCVGAGAYTGGLAPLKFAPNDARAFAKTLEETYGFEPSTVDLVVDGEDGKVGRSPTGANILGGLDRLLADRRLDRGDLFVFFFSGHGVGTASGDYLMPTDVPESEAEKRGIPVKTLIERFVRAGLKNVLVVADACRSGAKNPFGQELRELGRKANIAVLLGCAPGQRSYEYPRLQKGVFTHFLVRAMADSSLTDPTSGALWASAVAAKVSKQVKSYTEADYGDDPQVPAVWSEPSQDVLLAAYPPKSEETKEAFRVVSGEFKAGRLDPNRYRRYLSGLGEALRANGRAPEAIGAFKTLDGLGLATWGDLFSLAVALNGEDRDNEIGSLVARAARESAPTDKSELVVLMGQPSYLGVARYRQALARVSDPKTYGFTGATLLVTLSRGRLRLSDAAVARGLAPYVALFPQDSAEGRYVAAHIALGEKRYPEAIALAEAATPQSSTEREELRQVRFSAAEATKDEAKIDALIAEGEADAESSFPWTTTRLKRMQARKDPGFAAAVKKAAAATDFDRRLTEFLLLLGPDAGELAPDAERLVQVHPYSWQAAINAWLAGSAKSGLTRVPELPDAAFKYAPDRGDLVRYALNRWDDLLEQARLANRVSGTEAAEARSQLIGAYVGEWDHIQDAPVALMGLGRMFMRAGLGVRGAYFGQSFLFPYAQKQNYVRQELLATSLYLALNGADEETARAAFAMIQKEGGLAPRILVRYVLHQALIDDAKEAERAIALWPTLGRGEPDDLVRGYFDFSRALLLARHGEHAKVEALIEGRRALDRASGMLAYLALYQSHPERGLSKELAEFIIHPDPEFADLQLAAVTAALRGYAAPKDEDARAVRRALSRYLAQEPAHPWVRELGYDGADGLAAFAGSTEWAGTFDDGRTTEAVKLTLTVDAKGTAKGTLTLTDSKTTLALAGEVDAKGNLTSDATFDGKTVFILAMKLPPLAAVTRMVGGTEDPGLHEFRATLLKTPQEGAVLRIEPKAGRPL